MGQLKLLKTIYDKLKNDRLRSLAFRAADAAGIRKDVIRMDTNNVCNIRCIMCTKPEQPLKVHILSFEDFKIIIDSFARKTRMLYLSCAFEPLTTPDFYKYAAYAKYKKIPFVSLCTNGVLLNKKTAYHLVKAGVDEIIISFNGFRENTYEKIMAGSDFKKVCENIRILNEYKIKAGVKKPEIRLNTMLLRSNLENIDDVLPFMTKYGVNSIQFREMVPYENQNNPEAVKEETISSLTPNEYEAIVEKVSNAAEKIRLAGKEIILPVNFAAASSVGNNVSIKETPNNETPKKTSIIKTRNSEKNTCCIPCFSYWIDREGYVRVCGFDERAILGNILKEDIASLQKKRREFQRLALSGKCSNELCLSNIDSHTIL